MDTGMDRRFLVTYNPEQDSQLPYLLRLPIDGGLVLRAKERWPAPARVFCFDAGDPWPDGAELLDDVRVTACRRRGIAIDLVLDRGRQSRSQFIFTTARGRPAIFWQTPAAARNARPGVRVPARRASGHDELVIAADTRERYGYRFAAQRAAVVRQMLRAGDYAVLAEDGSIAAAVERKSVADLATSLVDRSLGFALAELAELPRAAVVVEGRYGDLLHVEHVQPGFVLDLLARLQVRYPGVPIVFAGSRKLAEEYTFRFLGAARAELA
jgi:ERCC4 domain-containing protein